jgi:hypothetical protein
VEAMVAHSAGRGRAEVEQRRSGGAASLRSPRSPLDRRGGGRREGGKRNWTSVMRRWPPMPRRPSSQFVLGGGGGEGTVRWSHDGLQSCGPTAWLRVYGVRGLGLDERE